MQPPFFAMNRARLYGTQKNGIILAADVHTIDQLESLVSITKGYPEVVAVKIGFSLCLRNRMSSVVRAVRDNSDLRVIYDHQKAATDIPAMGEEFASACSAGGVDAIILFPQAGPHTLRGFVEGANHYNLVPIVGLAMTHPGYLASEGGYLADETPARIARDAVALGVQDFVLPGTKLSLTRQITADHLNQVTDGAVMMPGIGSQGGEISPAIAAVQPLSGFAIVGSAIYKATDPAEALSKFVAQFRIGEEEAGRKA